ncbi:MAG: SRPBCC family protein [Gammaproteobacteria bacterium]|nr:SRPBCC family protein [Gammaproteobacteria bacterium]
MSKLLRLCSWGLIVVPALGFADGLSRLKLTEQTEIKAPPAKVWEMIKDFCSISKWHPAIANCVSEGGSAAGAKRVLTLKQEGNPRIDEEMLTYDETAMTFKYKIKKVDLKVLPVTSYSAFMTVKPNDQGGSIVFWNGGFYRGYPNNNPPPELNDQAAIKAVTGIYQSGLANLKKLAEANGVVRGGR